MTPREHLQARINSAQARVCVMGLGYVGLPLAGALHDAGLSVLGFDTDPSKIEALRAGRSYLAHLGADLPARLAASPRFEPTGDPSRLGACDVVIVCVPTPLGEHQEPDLSFVVGSAKAIGRTLRSGQLLVLESTTYPGTTRGVFWPAALGARAPGAPALELGRDVFVAYSPEREDPGNPSHTTRTIPKLVGGLDDASADLAEALYRRALERVVRVPSAEVAEAAKLLENVFRAVNIALVNELKTILTPMGIDVWDVISAASTKPFGFMPFTPGPGLGGHCIPIDPYYLAWKAREIGHSARFIELAGEVNTRMPAYVVERLARALSDDAKAVRGARVLLLGVAYKPDVGDVRETPAAPIIEDLLERGAAVDYHDPHVPVFPKMRKHTVDLASVPLTAWALEAADAVLIVTDHGAIDWALVGHHARLIVDTRNTMARFPGARARIIKA